MKPYVLTFKALSPLLLRERQTTQTSRSYDYISGSTLLGGLAHSYLRKHGLSSDTIDMQFQLFFLHEQVRFGNLYPANFASFRPAPDPVKPLPKTARSCKRWEGFAYQVHETDTEDRHGVVDHLILWALFKESNNLNIFDENRYCQACRTLGRTERLDSFSGYYQRYAPGEYERSTLNRRLITGTGINRLTGTVSDEILFNYDVIAELTSDQQPQKFQGLVYLDDVVEQVILDFLTADSLDLRVGKAKTRGLGRLQLLSWEPVNTVPYTQFKKRLTDFDDYMKEVVETFKVQLEAAFYFSITCCSDLILRTRDLRYHICLEAATLARQLGLEDFGRLKLVYHHASTEKTGGWNALWRLPKQVDLAISKGSVFLFSYTGDSQDNLIDKLYTLEQQGIGSRKSEGFGWVSVSDKFHQEGIQV